MCETKANGGKRCAAHTRIRFDAATLGTPAWDTAATEYARTNEGRKRLTQAVMSAVSNQDWSAAAAHQSALAAAERANAAQADYNNRVEQAVQTAVTTGDVGKLRKWSRSDDARIVEAVAVNRRTPDDVLRALAADGSIRVRCILAQRSRVPDDVLKRLARDDSVEVRYSGSLTSGRPHSVVSLWATTNTGDRRDFHLRANAVDAAELAGYGDILDHLAGDSDYRVRASVTTKSHTSTEALRRLSVDRYPSVAAKAARYLAQRELEAERAAVVEALRAGAHTLRDSPDV